MTRIWALLVGAPALLAGQVRLLTVEKHSNDVAMYDDASGKRLAVIPVGTLPHEFALSADGKLLYVTNYGLKSWNEDAPGGHTISIIDVRAAKTIGEIDLGEYHRPHGIVRALNGHLYVTADLPPSLLEVDPVKRSVVRRLDVQQKLPHMVLLSQDEKKAWTANAGSGSITVLSLTGPPNPRIIPTGGDPMGFVLTPDGKTLFATTENGNEVVVIDPVQDRITTRIPVKGGPARLAITPDGRYVLTSLIRSGELAIIDAATRREVRRVPVGAAAEGIAIDADSNAAYVSAQGDNKIVKFSLDDWRPLSTIHTTGSRPDPIIVLRPGTASPQ